MGFTVQNIESQSTISDTIYMIDQENIMGPTGPTGAFGGEAVTQNIIPYTGYTAGSSVDVTTNGVYFPNPSQAKEGGIDLGSSDKPFANLWVGDVQLSSNSLHLGVATISSNNLGTVNFSGGVTTAGLPVGSISIEGVVSSTDDLPDSSNLPIGTAYIVKTTETSSVLYIVNQNNTWSDVGTLTAAAVTVEDPTVNGAYIVGKSDGTWETNNTGKIFIGDNAGPGSLNEMGDNSIVIGTNSCIESVKDNSINIGSNITNPFSNSIVINASNDKLETTRENGCFISPINVPPSDISLDTDNTYIMYYISNELIKVKAEVVVPPYDIGQYIDEIETVQQAIENIQTMEAVAGAIVLTPIAWSVYTMSLDPNYYYRLLNEAYNSYTVQEYSIERATRWLLNQLLIYGGYPTINAGLYLWYRITGQHQLQNILKDNENKSIVAYDVNINQVYEVYENDQQKSNIDTKASILETISSNIAREFYVQIYHFNKNYDKETNSSISDYSLELPLLNNLLFLSPLQDGQIPVVSSVTSTNSNGETFKTFNFAMQGGNNNSTGINIGSGNCKTIDFVEKYQEELQQPLFYNQITRIGTGSAHSDTQAVVIYEPTPENEYAYYLNGGMVAIGFESGINYQNVCATAIGQMAGTHSQGPASISIGFKAGHYSQGEQAIAIGYEAGFTGQADFAIAIGADSGRENQGMDAIAIGVQSGRINQESQAIAIGFYAGTSDQKQNAIAMGYQAGYDTQRENAIAIGQYTGQASQGISTVAIGNSAGQIEQGQSSIAIGQNSGQNIQGNYSVAIGNSAGQNNQQYAGVAIGYGAGQNTQDNYAVAIGNSAGQIKQQNSGVAIGYAAGQNTQGIHAIAIGTSSGEKTQGNNAIAFGNNAGQYTQGNSAIAIGDYAGTISQGIYAIAIGKNTGRVTQGQYTIAIGANCGFNSQGNYAVSIGSNSGMNTQGTSSVAIGYDSGSIKQGNSAIAIGLKSGYSTQGKNAVAIGQNCGLNSQGENAITIGTNTGKNNQGIRSVAIGNNVGEFSQGIASFAIGDYAAQYSQGLNSVAIGQYSAQYSQGNRSVAIGQYAGNKSQKNNAIAIGENSGRNTQGTNSIAIGIYAGENSQGTSAIAIGEYAGNNKQGINSIAIGENAGKLTQHANTIILNASGSNLNSTTSSSTYINPIRNNNSQTTNTLCYNTSTKEITYNTASVVSQWENSTSNSIQYLDGLVKTGDILASSPKNEGLLVYYDEGVTQPSTNTGIVFASAIAVDGAITIQEKTSFVVEYVVLNMSSNTNDTIEREVQIKNNPYKSSTTYTSGATNTPISYSVFTSIQYNGSGNSQDVADGVGIPIIYGLTPTQFTVKMKRPTTHSITFSMTFQIVYGMPSQKTYEP